MQTIRLKEDAFPLGGLNLEYLLDTVNVLSQNTAQFKDHTGDRVKIFLAEDDLEERAVNAGKMAACYVSKTPLDVSWSLRRPEVKSTFVFLVARKNQRDALRPLTHGSSVERGVQIRVVAKTMVSTEMEQIFRLLQNKTSSVANPFIRRFISAFPAVDGNQGERISKVIEACMSRIPAPIKDTYTSAFFVVEVKKILNTLQTRDIQQLVLSCKSNVGYHCAAFSEYRQGQQNRSHRQFC